MGLKHILMSVRPEHAENIISGRKTFEYRRRPPDICLNVIIHIYATLPVGKVIGHVAGRCVVRGSHDYVWEQTRDGGCITREQFDEYFKGLPIASAIELHMPKRLEHPEPLHGRAPQSWRWLA